MSTNTVHRPTPLKLAGTAETFETTREKWARRLITVPAVLILSFLATAALPFLLAAAGAVDLLLRRQGAVTRTLLLLWFLLLMESIGIGAAFVLWLRHPRGNPQHDAEHQALHYRLQHWWGTNIARAGLRLFRIRLEVESDYAFGRRPIVLFVRHTSSIDTLLPIYLLSRPYGLRLRYVLKRELLWDPCLDIVGQRLPNVFVRRRPSGNRGEAAALRQLAAGATGPVDGVLIYPEGTRFTPAKQARIRQAWRQSRPEMRHYAAELEHVLPPRTGGALALLQGNPNADAVFCVHTGFEPAGSLGALLRGRLIDATIRVAFFSIPAADIPREPTQQADWLRNQWRRVDAEVGRLRHSSRAAAPPCTPTNASP